MIEAPKPSRDEAIHAMEKQIVKHLPELDPINTEISNPIAITPEHSIVNPAAQTPNTASDKSFQDMLKRVGIR
ncbi:MAG: hypothetical protein PHQ41_11250 [Candidatus Cloacimonetes bacterium]|nr:hypothetical protein [Candidatus Cloacimonadota bacterium]